MFLILSDAPSYEYDKTLSKSHYGHFKIKIENQLLNLKTVNIQMLIWFGLNSREQQISMKL